MTDIPSIQTIRLPLAGVNTLNGFLALKAIAPFVCAHPYCAAEVYGREQVRSFNTGAYGAIGEGVMFEGL